MTEEKIEKNKKLTVSKSNILIQNAKFDLSAREQKTIAFICSLIKPSQSAKETITFKILDYGKVCNLKRNGNLYEETKEIITKLTSKVIWVQDERGRETTTRWIDKTWIDRNGTIEMRIDETMQKYIFELKSKFTAYELENILKMKSQYAIQIFEIMKSYEFRKVIELDLQKLKEMLKVDKIKTYENFADFKRRILDRAVNEINEKSELNVAYIITERDKKKVTKLKFFIENKKKKQERTQLQKKAYAQKQFAQQSQSKKNNSNYDISMLDGIGLLD